MKSFRSFRLDPANQSLWRGEDSVPLTPKAFDVLRYLVEHPGRLVTQDEILDVVWSETYVNSEVIRKYIQEIRKVLGDLANKPVFIATLPKRGYRFIAPVIDETTATPLDLPTDAAKKIVGRETALAELDHCLTKTERGQRQIIFSYWGTRHRKNHAGRRIPAKGCQQATLNSYCPRTVRGGLRR